MAHWHYHSGLSICCITQSSFCSELCASLCSTWPLVVTEGTPQTAPHKLQYKWQAAAVQILTSPSPTPVPWLYCPPQHAVIAAGESYKTHPVSTFTGRSYAHGSPVKDPSSCIAGSPNRALSVDQQGKSQVLHGEQHQHQPATAD